MGARCGVGVGVTDRGSAAWLCWVDGLVTQLLCDPNGLRESQRRAAREGAGTWWLAHVSMLQDVCLPLCAARCTPDLPAPSPSPQQFAHAPRHAHSPCMLTQGGTYCLKTYRACTPPARGRRADAAGFCAHTGCSWLQLPGCVGAAYPGNMTCTQNVWCISFCNKCLVSVAGPEGDVPQSVGTIRSRQVTTQSAR